MRRSKKDLLRKRLSLWFLRVKGWINQVRIAADNSLV
jgi:hypothetical protein